MTAASQQELVQMGRDHLYPNYRQPDMVLSHGRGVEVFDVEGKRYLDFMAGIAVNALGHAHPRWVEAIRDQAGRLTHVSNYFFNEPNVRLAEKLCRLSGFDRAFFCNSGTEAIEASLKLARRFFFNRGQVDRHRVVAFRQSFHGRTMGALAATGQAAYRDGFGPLGSVTHVDFGDVEGVTRAMDETVAAVLVEPIQGEGGVVPAPAGFLKALRDITKQRGALLILDEIQTGIGRTGTFLACEQHGVKPDVVALAKGLGGGIPIGAMVCTKEFETALPPGSHGSTFGGNPLASAGALATLEVLESESLLAHTSAMGELLSQALSQLAQRHPKKTLGARGVGLLQGLVLSPDLDTRELLERIRNDGLLLTIAGGTALRFSPPLVVNGEQIQQAVGIVNQVLESLS